MSMLEKAAKAAWLTLVDADESDWPDNTGLSVSADQIREAVWAALFAVRDPGGYVIDQGAKTACGLPEAEATWQRMVDAILLETPPP